jgi:hypothetical protein
VPPWIFGHYRTGTKTGTPRAHRTANLAALSGFEAEADADVDPEWEEIERRLAASRAQRDAEDQRRAEERERFAAEQAEAQIDAVRAEIIEVLASLTPREAANLPPELLAELESVLE